MEDEEAPLDASPDEGEEAVEEEAQLLELGPCTSPRDQRLGGSLLHWMPSTSSIDAEHTGHSTGACRSSTMSHSNSLI
jgi:hypothetical protein